MHCAEGLELPDYMMAQEEILEDPVKEAQIQPEEELEEINLGAGLGSYRLIFISSQLVAQENEQLVALLKKYVDMFAWTYDEMPGLNLGLVVHSLNVDPGVKPVVQQLGSFTLIYKLK